MESSCCCSAQQRRIRWAWPSPSLRRFLFTHIVVVTILLLAFVGVDRHTLFSRSSSSATKNDPEDDELVLQFTPHLFAPTRPTVPPTAHRPPLKVHPSPTLRPTRSPSSPPSTLPPSQAPLPPTPPPTLHLPTPSPIVDDTVEDSASAATVVPDLHLLAYYYPWYIRHDWSQHGYVDTPLLGLYGTDDPQMVQQHLTWARHRANLTALVLSWWHPDAITTRHIQQGFLVAMANTTTHISWCLHYESLGALPTTDFADPRALAQLQQDVAYWRDHYFSHPAYYRIDGRPVVVLYVTRTWQHFEPWMLETLLDHIFWIADEPFFHAQQHPATARNGLRHHTGTVFDAYTTYNMFEDALVHEGETATDYMRREAYPIFRQWAQSTLFFPNVLPMYHDFRGHLPLAGSDGGLREQLEEVSCLPHTTTTSSVPRLVFVTSWNEWWEGSQIEPDNANRYGFSYMDTLRNFTQAYPVPCDGKH